MREQVESVLQAQQLHIMCRPFFHKPREVHFCPSLAGRLHASALYACSW